MKQWYRSGMEGYCKAAAKMMGLPDNNSGWGNFGRDLFADGRFDDSVKASKAWTLSRDRAQGRSNRPKLFEESWLGQHGQSYELEAIHTCVHSMCGKTSESSLYELYLGAPDSFAADFHEIALPAIEDGFEAERYHPADIARFSQGIDKALSKLDPSLPQTFRNFAIPLVAGIIYGPDHPVAQSSTNSATLHRTHEGEEGELPPAAVDERTIILTQLFSEDAGLVGHSSHFGDDCAILLGRDSDKAGYLDACGSVFTEIVESRETKLFPVAHTHKSTSKAHGVIARVGETWYFHDFSSNGSYIANERRPSTVHRGVVALSPGDRIFLGLCEPPADDEAAYRLATAVLVSFALDESSFADPA